VTVLDLQLAEDVGDVELDGANADIEPVANLSIAEVPAASTRLVHGGSEATCVCGVPFLRAGGLSTGSGVKTRTFVPIMTLCCWGLTGQPKEQEPLIKPLRFSTGWNVCETQ
jgi:hypothetical protein